VTDPRRPWRVLPLLALVGATLIAGCNRLFGIHEGTPRPMCTDLLMIDDMEDGDRSICRTSGRTGGWYDLGDGTLGDLTPKSDATFTPTRIEDGSRGSSRYAARFAGSGFTSWGALMGFDLLFPRQAYDAGSLSAGITFWMKSNVPVSVEFPTSETVPINLGGECVDGATLEGCNQHFEFQITAPAEGWFEYQVPFNALSRGGSAVWNPRHLHGVSFRVPQDTTFEVWIDDVAFYNCAGTECQPTCTDPQYPVSCRIGNGPRSSCAPPGTDCSAVATWCVDPLLIDDMEDGDAAICDSGEWYGDWSAGGDGTSKDLTPADGAPFLQTAIPGGRGASRYAARLTGSGFWAWGAGMRFSLDSYDASQVSGIKFWMKSDVPVTVGFDTPATSSASTTVGAACQDSPTELNCGHVFSFEVGASGNAWVERTVPFAALRQTEAFHGIGNLLPGSATWDPSRLLGIDFGTLLSAFDIWIDDVRFLACQGESCLPSCSEESQVACPAAGGRPADCWPKGTDCSNPPQRINLWGVWGAGPNDIWAVGHSASTLKGTMLHWNGATWSADTSSARPPMFVVWSSGPSDLWAMGDQGTILHGDGFTWAAVPSGTNSTFTSIWGSGPNDVWAIEVPGTLRHWKGTAWSTDLKADGYLVAVWGTGPHDVWAVGLVMGALHWDGSAWSTTTLPTTTGKAHPLFGVWGTSSHDIWAVGGAGDIVHWDGSAWLPIPGDTVMSLNGVWGAGPSDVWAVGDYGTIVHWDGLAWHILPSSTRQKLNAVWGNGPSDVWAVGYGSTILHWDGVVWSPSSL
jgi:hypothetical protein